MSLSVRNKRVQEHEKTHGRLTRGVKKRFNYTSNPRIEAKSEGMHNNTLQPLDGRPWTLHVKPQDIQNSCVANNKMCHRGTSQVTSTARQTPLHRASHYPSP